MWFCILLVIEHFIPSYFFKIIFGTCSILEQQYDNEQTSCSTFATLTGVAPVFSCLEKIGESFRGCRLSSSLPIATQEGVK